MSEEQERDKMVEDTWRMFLTEGRNTKEFKYRHLFSLLPSTHAVGSAMLHSTASARR